MDKIEKRQFYLDYLESLNEDKDQSKNREKKLKKQREKIKKFLNVDYVINYIFRNVISDDSTKGLKYTIWVANAFKEKFKNELLKNKTKLTKLIKNNVLKSIEYIRGIEEIDYDNIVDISSKIRQMFNDSKLIDDDDTDLGDDFDDPESHKITEITKKISSGWPTIDKVMEGGWDQASLNVLMGETGVGKSMWMQNIATQTADQGGNVLFITLEMGSQKCMKRMGSMRLKIPIKEYNKRAKDTIFMKNKINSLKMKNGGIFNAKPGKIIVKKYDTGTCTITDIDNFITKFEEKKGIKINMVIVDYINIMGIEKGLDFANMLFLKGKHLAEGLRYIGDRHNCAVITGSQTDKAVWGASDIDLKNMPESKAIAETADSVWAIIRNPEMKKNNIYRFKILKLRDSEHSGEQIRFDFNTTFLVMENDEFVGIV